MDSNCKQNISSVSSFSRSNSGSFKKKETVSSTIAEKHSPGVKSWSVGSSLGLISSGHAQLDKLIGGGFTLGSTCMQEIDNYSDYGRTLLYYNICESLSNGHITFIVLPNKKDGDLLLSKLPWNISKSSEVFDARRSSYCYSYDLSKSVQQEIVTSSKIEWIYIDSIAAEYSSSTNKIIIKLEFILERIYHLLSTGLASSSSDAVVHRVFIPCMYEILAVSDILPHELAMRSRVLAQFVLRLKHRIRSINAFLHICIAPALLLSCPILSTQLCHICDTVLAVQSFAGRAHTIPHEFAEFSGFLMVLKTQDSGMFAPFRPSSSRFGLKRDRRKLHIEPLHLPPEQNRAFAGVGGFDPLPTPSTSSSTSTSIATVSSEHSHGVEIHYHHPRGVQPDLNKNNLSESSNSSSIQSGSTAGTATTSSTNSSSSASNQSKLSFSLAAIKAARESAAVDALTAPTLLTLPAPISIAATRPKDNQRIGSSSKKIEF